VKSVVLSVGTALLVALMVAPSQAASRVGAPWIVAASPTSVTLDWPGHGSFRVYSERQGGGSKKSVRASTSTRKVAGLHPGTMYCFQVARANGSGRSRTYCHATPGPVVAPATTSIGVATFNVCASVCKGWKKRHGAITRRIIESGADVVAVQELWGHGFSLGSDLIERGYVTVSSTNDATVLVRTSGPGSHLRHQGDTEDGIVRGFGAGSPWITMYDTVTHQPYTFVSVHLESGTSRAAKRTRRRQAVALIQGMQASEAKGRVIYAGDFNISPARHDDNVGRVFARAGYIDAYQQSASFAKSWMSSSNGFESKPRRDVKYGDHIDRIFVPRGFGVSDWAVVAPLRRGRNVRPMASDHHPVRATVWLR
jgi:endonuclease/exonuclease/phosphatase family metal-dependent hydrolase